MTEHRTGKWSIEINDFFFSMREQVESCESYNLIGSESRQNFSVLLAIPGGNYPSPGCVSLCNDRKFQFFDTESVYIQKRRENRFK